MEFDRHIQRTCVLLCSLIIAKCAKCYWTNVKNYEVFYLSFNLQIPLTLKAFGQSIQLNLHRTNYIVPAFDVWKYNTISVIEKWSQSETLHCCFYVHENDISFAVINFCPEHGWVSTIALKI